MRILIARAEEGLVDLTYLPPRGVPLPVRQVRGVPRGNVVSEVAILLEAAEVDRRARRDRATF